MINYNLKQWVASLEKELVNHLQDISTQVMYANGETPTDSSDVARLLELTAKQVVNEKGTVMAYRAFRSPGVETSKQAAATWIQAVTAVALDRRHLEIPDASPAGNIILRKGIKA